MVQAYIAWSSTGVFDRRSRSTVLPRERQIQSLLPRKHNSFTMEARDPGSYEWYVRLKTVWLGRGALPRHRDEHKEPLCLPAVSRACAVPDDPGACMYLHWAQACLLLNGPQIHCMNPPSKIPEKRELHLV